MHLTGISLQNIRVFRELQKFNFAPLTVLIGPNNSGKSTLSKVLLLLKDTFKIYPTEHPPFCEVPRLVERDTEFNNHNFPQKLIFDGNSLHNLGGINSLISKNSKTNSILIKLPFLFPEIKESKHGWVQLVYFHKKAETKLQSITIEINDIVVYSAIIKHKGSKTPSQKMKVNFAYFLEKLEKNQIHTYDPGEEIGYEEHTGYEFASYNGVSDELSFQSSLADFGKFFCLTKAYNADKEDRYFDWITLPADEDLSEKTKKKFDFYVQELFNLFTNKGWLELETSGSQEIGYDSVTKQLNKSLSALIYEKLRHNKKITHLISGRYDKYIEKYGLRQTEHSQSVYFIPTNKMKNVFGIIDRSISFNLAEYTNLFANLKIWSLTDIDFDSVIDKKEIKLYQLLKDYKQIQSLAKTHRKAQEKYSIFNFVSHCLNFVGLGEGINIKRIYDYGFEVSLNTVNGHIPLKDVGFGVKKMISLILGIAAKALESKTNIYDTPYGSKEMRFHPNLLIIEEPEANLHPRYQSYVADILYLAMKSFNMQFIVETHSEYIVRKLQLMVADTSQSLSNKHVSIIYFQNPSQYNNSKPMAYDLGMRADGILKNDFGAGFFDEATSLTVQLLKQQK